MKLIVCFPSKYDHDQNLRLTRDELENFFRDVFGETPSSFEAAFQVCQYTSAATRGREAVDLVRFMKLLYMMICPAGPFHPSKYDPDAAKKAYHQPERVLSKPDSKSKTRPKRFTNVRSDKFIPTKLLGQGGQGVVEAGTYEGVTCAGKTFYRAPGPELMMEVKAEVDLFLQLNHPNCHYLLGANTSLDKGGIIMLTEICEMGSLYDLFSKQRLRFDDRTAMRVATECASGMEFIHNLGYMHRDIKSL